MRTFNVTISAKDGSYEKKFSVEAQTRDRAYATAEKKLKVIANSSKKRVTSFDIKIKQINDEITEEMRSAI